MHFKGRIGCRFFNVEAKFQKEEYNFVTWPPDNIPGYVA